MSLHDLQLAVVDLETSSLDPSTGNILQVAVVGCDTDGRETSTWCTDVRPRWWPFTSVGPTEVHGITRRRLRTAPNLREALEGLVQRIDGRVFVAHNAEFDLGYVQHHAARLGIPLPDVPVICTLSLSRHVNRETGLSHRLTDVCARYGVALTNAHDALADARATAAIVPHLLAESGITSLESLLLAAAPAPRRRPRQERS